MKEQIRGVFSLVLLVSMLTSMVLPQEGNGQDIDKIKFNHLTIEDGLSHHEVSFVLQDVQGFMWFGTKYGLNKYDGMKMTVFTHDPENSNSLCGNFVWWLQKGKDGTLWIPTWGGGLSRLDPKTGVFTNYHHDREDPKSIGGDLVWSVYEDRKGRIWAAPDSGGLNKFNPETDTWFRYLNDSKDPKSLSHNSVSVICEDSQGMLWVATYGGGLNKFDPEKETFTRYQHDSDNPDSLSDNNLWYVYIDSHGKIWVGTEKGLNRFEPETEKFTRYQHDKNDPGSLSFDTVTSIHEDKKGILWVGTFGGGLNRFDPEKEIFVHYKHDFRNTSSLINNTVTSIYEDTTGTLWVSTYGGVDKYDPWGNQFENYSKKFANPNGLNNNNVRSLYQDKKGSIWIGTEGGGLNYLDNSRNIHGHYMHDIGDPTTISSNDILTIGADRRDDLWIGTNGAGLNKFNAGQGIFLRYRHDPHDSNTIGSDTIYDLAVDQKRDILWLAVYMAGLDKFDIAQEKFVHYTHDKTNPYSLSSNWVTALFLDSNGKVWIGGEPGLSQFNPVTEVFTHYTHDRNDHKSLSSDLVYTIYEDSQGAIWIGTNNGLNRYDKFAQTFIRYFVKDGLAGNRVVAIEEDDRGFLWISTDKGLSSFDPGTKIFRNYDQWDDLQGNRFHANSSFKNASGELFFGGTNGFNSFYPNQLTDNPYVPRIAFTNFMLFNKPVPVGGGSPLTQPINMLQQIVLEHDQSMFNIEFVALNYKNSQKNQYAYMLEGFDKDFTYTDSHTRSVTYTHLDPGRYSFHVKGSNNDGLWNEEGRSIEIIILPHWTETFWFKGTVLGLAAGLIFGIFRFRTRSIKQLNRQLERIVVNRTRELKNESDKAHQARQLAEENAFNISRQTAFVQAVLENISDGIVACDENGILTMFNRATRKMHGIKEENLPPEQWASHYDLYLADGKTLMKTEDIPLYRAFLGERLVNEEMVLAPKNVEKHIVLASGQPLIDEKGAKRGAVVSLHDITNQKQVENQLLIAKEVAERASQAKSEFLANMSHELRTPLNIILGYTQLMERDSTLSKEQREEFRIINQNGKNLLSLINDVLDIRKIEAGQTTLSEKSFDLNDFLSSLSELFHKQAVNKGLFLSIEKGAGIPRHIKGDKVKLRQVLINLLSNALKFTAKGGVTLRLRTGETISDMQTLHFEVEDTGIGIAPDLHEEIFKPFAQVQDSSGHTSGTGLGLAISHQFVNIMGGRIEVESKIGKGSLFRFSIAAGKSGIFESKDSLPSRKVIGLAPEQPSYRILVVEDKLESRKLLVKLLKTVGFEVKEASEGKQSLKVFNSWAPDLVCMDMHMPVMNGYEAVKEIRKTKAGQKTVVIALTANAFEEERQEILNVGCNDFIRKPYLEEEFFASMEEHLGVQFIYDDPEAVPLDLSKNSIDILAHEIIDEVPNEIKNELLKVAGQLDQQVCLLIIDQLYETHKPIASALRILVENYQYEELENLFRPKNNLTQ